MKISILLPYKENFSSTNAGAVSLFVKDICNKSLFKENITIYGDTVSKHKLLKNFIHLETKNKIYLSKTKAYLDEFIKYEKNQKSEIIEIHNRPAYINHIRNSVDAKIILYFHNDPLSMKGSVSTDDRKNLLIKTSKIVFNSKWCLKRFTKNLNKNLYKNKIIVIPQSTSKTKINFIKKKNIISFVGKLNTSKGYDAFGKAIVKILDEFKNWSSIVIGDEPREKIYFTHKRLKLYGFKTNSFILNKLKEVSISVVPSKWDEPFGRSSLEASSRGCALIISKNGGLPETTKNAIVLKNVNELEIYNNIKKLINNYKLRTKIQKLCYKNFYLTNNYVSRLNDNLRKKIIEINSINLKKLKKIKILHITNLNERFDGRLHYNTGKRLNNGFVRLGHNVLSISDRDIISNNKSIVDIYGTRTLNKKIIMTQSNFKADLIVLGHVDNIKHETILKLKQINNPKICQWFLDPLMKNGPDYNKNSERITSIDKIIDATFLTSHPEILEFKLYNSFFIPNPCDVSFETLDNSKNNPNKDLFFAMSHGVHRGVLKGGKYDEREIFLNKLKKKIKEIKFDIFGMNGVNPIWGEKYLSTIKDYKMGLNLSRGNPVKYYSSDRIVQLIGNGLLTFINKKTKLYEIINPKGVVYYDNLNDLVKKIKFYKKKHSIRKKIAARGKKDYFKKFNSNLVCQYIIDKTFNIKNKNKYFWD